MTRLVVTDQLVGDALRPDPSAVTPPGLLAQIATDVARTPQRRFLPFPALPQSRQLALVAIGAATLVALASALLFAAGSPKPSLVNVPPARSVSPAPSPTRPPYFGDLPVSDRVTGAEIIAVDADEVWTTAGGRLWHRTAARGWTEVDNLPRRVGPYSSIDEEILQIRDLDRLPDGRVVIGADSGIYVGDESGWILVRQSADPRGGSTYGVGVDAAGTIWAPGLWQDGVAMVSIRDAGSWSTDHRVQCPAGGMLVAPAADGSVWTAGIEYGGTAGVARLDGDTCVQLFPYGDELRHDVSGITADGQGRVAMVVHDIWGDAVMAGGRIVVWEDGRWTTLREGAGSAWGVTINTLSYAPDGSLWIAFDEKLWRFEGTEGAAVRNAAVGPVSVAPDGTVWYVGIVDGQAVVTRLLPNG